VADSCEKDSTQLDNNRQSQQSSFVYCMVLVHCVSAEQETIITQILLFYIIRVYGWDLNFTSSINIYDV
jgi:hypothetical protein